MRRGNEIEAFVAAARKATGQPTEFFDVFAFGDSPGMADELAALVASGRKRATASLLGAYEAGEPLPLVGEFSVALDGRGLPVALIRTREVTIQPFCDVDKDFARDEGEGDLSLGYWREAHRSFFTRAETDFAEDSPVVCERFDLVYPRQPQP